MAYDINVIFQANAYIDFLSIWPCRVRGLYNWSPDHGNVKTNGMVWWVILSYLPYILRGGSVLISHSTRVGDKKHLDSLWYYTSVTTISGKTEFAAKRHGVYDPLGVCSFISNIRICILFFIALLKDVFWLPSDHKASFL